MRGLALAVLVLAAGCGGASETEGGACAAAVVYDDTVYLGEHIRHNTLRPGEPLDGGISPACHDTIPADPDEHDEPTELRRVRGVDPAIAVWVPGEGRRSAVYVNRGSFPEVRGHPLHEAIYAGEDPPQGLRRPPNCRFDGTVERMGLSVEIQPATGLERFVTAQLDTRIEGFERGGWHVLRRGDRVHVVGVCHWRQVTAQLIEPQA
jgi:hypothetical protein